MLSLPQKTASLKQQPLAKATAIMTKGVNMPKMKMYAEDEKSGEVLGCSTNGRAVARERAVCAISRRGNGGEMNGVKSYEHHMFVILE
ncbi:hypothetical protein HPP92_011879 [Vanilla planifolia]|uniref:Uncharacterized protein n=1 Tax=Vanilla planifolia TaxID=51239 RepID=A0A835R7A8_VANPL|nr:hypothetical protein HPP92_012210 [Vanilla planifolia]KAG0483795.1 hypothetical protein HPP92_011879 [Vanilla planifolia]